ncbi:MAG TPA: NAD-dependent epimerase/dehydratase family protein, partial [Dehalococcoidia bacterium]|nr:NAD-dependent epimerase/dehydratase family protein [Dehalococcoidia bacterium]
RKGPPGMRVLVTGATGFLGSHVAGQLAAAGHTVRVLLRPTSDRSFLAGFPWEEALGDVSDPTSLPAALDGVEAAVHAAGLVKARSAAQFYAVNAGGTRNLLDAVDRAAPRLHRFVLISSLAAHGPSEDGEPRPADASARPVTAYGRSKLAAEETLRCWPRADRAVIIRPPVIYGPRDKQLLPFFRLARLRLAPLLAGGRHRVSCVYVEDAARAVAEATTAEAPVGGRAYFIDDGSPYSWRDLLAAVEQAVGTRALALSTPRWAYSAAALAAELYGLVTRQGVSLTREKVLEMSQPHWVCSHAALQRDLGWSPQVQLEEGARLTAAWYRAHGWL